MPLIDLHLTLSEGIWQRARSGLASIVDAAARAYADLNDRAVVFRMLVPVAREEGWALSTYGMMVAEQSHRDAAASMPDIARAASLLEEAWSDRARRLLICSLALYAYPVEMRPIAERRSELLTRASERFDDGLYAEAVLLIYSQLDGMFHDRADESGEAAFAHVFKKRPLREDVRNFKDIVSETGTMVGTEDDFFLGVRAAMSANVSATTLDDHPSRHGVLHGRVLGFDNRRRASQAFAFLAGGLEVLIASRDQLPLTHEEKHGTLYSESAPGLRFVIQTRMYQPVRSIYMMTRTASAKPVFLAMPDARPPGELPRGSATVSEAPFQ
jgi:hypothetical protein